MSCLINAVIGAGSSAVRQNILIASLFFHTRVPRDIIVLRPIILFKIQAYLISVDLAFLSFSSLLHRIQDEVEWLAWTNSRAGIKCPWRCYIAV